MPTIKFISAKGDEKEISGEVGKSVMVAAVSHGVPGIIGDCGGNCSCGTCHCYIDAEWAARLPVPSEMELSMLEGVLDLEANSRLCCQIQLTDELDGLVVRVPPSTY